jgi:hypothetical protein
MGFRGRHARRWSWIVHEGLNSAAESAWEANTRVIRDITRRGKQIFDRLEGKLRADSMHQWVRINVDTGDYVVGDTFSDVDEQFRARFGEAPSWKTRIGEPPYVFRSARLLR